MDMQATREEVIRLVSQIPEAKLESARDYLAYLALVNDTHTADLDEAERLARELFGDVSEEKLAAEDKIWEQTFEATADKLALFAREARDAYLSGNTTEIDDSGPELKPAS